MRSRRCWVVAGLIAIGGGLAAEASVAAPPYAYTVRVHSWGHDARARTEGYCWTSRRPLGTIRPPSPDTRCLNIDWELRRPVRYLPVRARQRMVIRLREAARSVAVRLESPEGRRLKRRRAAALGGGGLVWRVRVPDGIGDARVAIIGVRYRKTSTVAPVGIVRYEISACPLAFCEQPADGRIA